VELSEKYHEPPSEIVASLAELLDGPPVHKLLFSAPPEVVQTQLKAHWTAAVAGRASLTASQHDMLEILPLGASKGVGVELLLSHLGVQKEEVCCVRSSRIRAQRRDSQDGVWCITVLAKGV
jgi:hydroxymethylpyrimidine pyrophosphatase-like HAD family hydrolase